MKKKYDYEITIDSEDLKKNYDKILVNPKADEKYLLRVDFGKFFCEDLVEFKRGRLVAPKELIEDLRTGKIL